MKSLASKELAIEKNIPVQGPPKGYLLKMFNAMNFGDSVKFNSYRRAVSFKSLVYSHYRYMAKGRDFQFIQRKISEPGFNGQQYYRVWKIKRD